MKFHRHNTHRLNNDGNSNRGSTRQSDDQLRHSFLGCCQACLFCIPSSKRFIKKDKGPDNCNESDSAPCRFKSTTGKPPPPTPSSRTTGSTPYSSPASIRSPATTPSKGHTAKTLLDSEVKGRNVDSSFIAASSSSEKSSMIDLSMNPNVVATPAVMAGRRCCLW